MAETTLHEALQANSPGFYQSQVPASIYASLKAGFGQRPYQQEAFGRFVYYWNQYPGKPEGAPLQLLYHMATGSGKTLIMAGLMLYLYEKGYRNFLFFVNSTNIIDKTRDNFFNNASSKYLFSDSIIIGNRQVSIKEAANFQAAGPDDINIVFSTIQGLHSRLNTPRENSLTYEDFEHSKLVLISDEAHHINAETKKKKELSTDEKQEIISWEGTVNRIFNANPHNVLLEFTATADLSVPEIAHKYSQKLIFDYPLKQFRLDGYSKEVKVLQAGLSPFNRALQAVLLSQYRRKIFEKYKKQVKPVILFKSKTIKDSQAFLEEFITGIKNLQVADLEKLKHANPGKAIENVFDYLDANDIKYENLVTELKQDFSESRLIAVNSKDESEQKQLAVNSLEDEGNPYRAVFAVDKLNEGWDVLNLFDIVRLYDSQSSKAGKPGKTTMAEAQLIGRGARYYPFQVSENQAFFSRKYDSVPSHELRTCEELYYHSPYNPQYIQELNTALVKIGIKDSKARKQETQKAKSGQTLPENLPGKQQADASKEEAPGLKPELIALKHQVILRAGYAVTNNIFDSEQAKPIARTNKNFKLTDFEGHIIRKALNKLDFYHFSNLKKYLPRLSSVSEFIYSDNYLGQVKLTITGMPEQVSGLKPEEKMEAALQVLSNISAALVSDKTNFKAQKMYSSS